MFADDTTLLASSRKSLALMIKETKQALEKHGLKLNAGKCQVQTNKPGAKLRPLIVDGSEVPMVRASQGFKVPGTVYTLAGRTSEEVNTRVAAAWGKFHETWPLLRRGGTDLTKRLRLFDLINVE